MSDERSRTSIPTWVLDYRRGPSSVGSVAKLPMRKEKVGYDAGIADRFLLVPVRYAPTEQNVLAGIAARPDAEPILRRWQEVWSATMDSSSFCYDFSAGDAWLEKRLENERAFLEDENFANAAKARLEYERHSGFQEMRDPRLHLIDDANAFLSMLSAEPGWTALVIGDKTVRHLVGHDTNGWPVFENHPKYKFNVVVGHVHDDKMRMDSAVDHPRLEPYVAAGLREQVICDGMQHAVAVLAGMARRGDRKAFVKGMASKVGTWTVDLDGVTTLKQVASRLIEAVFPAELPRWLIVQEHLPFTHEQRFFVMGGRVLVGVCSDRNLCGLDARPGRRLDDRVAVILKVAGEPGEYDRGQTTHVVDRSMAAAFAKVARRFAREMAKAGVRDCIVDVGMTSRGPAVIETNEWLRSGPYCLDRDLVARLAKAGVHRFMASLGPRKQAFFKGWDVSEQDMDDLFAGCSADDLRELFMHPGRIPAGYQRDRWPAEIPPSEFGREAMSPEDGDEAAFVETHGVGAIPLFAIPATWYAAQRLRPARGRLLVGVGSDGRLAVGPRMLGSWHVPQAVHVFENGESDDGEFANFFVSNSQKARFSYDRFAHALVVDLLQGAAEASTARVEFALPQGVLPQLVPRSPSGGEYRMALV